MWIALAVAGWVVLSLPVSVVVGMVVRGSAPARAGVSPRPSALRPTTVSDEALAVTLRAAGAAPH